MTRGAMSVKGFLFSFFVLLLLFPSAVISQSVWSNIYWGGPDSGEEFFSIIETADQALLAAGRATLPTVGYGAWLVKTNLDGDTLWTRTYVESGWDAANEVIETSDQAYLFVGSQQGELSKPWMVKTNLSGDTLWTRRYGDNDEGGLNAVVETSDGGYLMVGKTRPADSWFFDAWMVKTDVDGIMEWEQSYGADSFNDEFNSIVETSDESYLVGGTGSSSGAGYGDLWLVKTNFSGDTLWTKTFGGANWEYGYSAIETIGNQYIIAGETQLAFGSGNYDALIIKTDLDGNEIWSRTYGGTRNDGVRSVIETLGGNLLLGGRTVSYGMGSFDIWLFKIDQQGNQVWSQTYGGRDGDQGESMILSSDEAIVIAGSYTSRITSSGEDEQGGVIIKTDSLGFTYPPVVSIQATGVIPKQNCLSVSPNPTNAACHISYTLTESSVVSVEISNILGKRVWGALLGERQPGSYSFSWNTKDSRGNDLESGVYILRVLTPYESSSKKLMVLK